MCVYPSEELKNQYGWADRLVDGWVSGWMGRWFSFEKYFHFEIQLEMTKY